MARLWIIVPCYNEEAVLAGTAKQLTDVVTGLVEKGKISDHSGILFVDDGSRDSTWEKITAEYQKNPHVYGLRLAANAGHQNALFAGLETVKDFADLSVSIDADLQDDIGVIEKMVDLYCGGCDIVYGVRARRKTDSVFKRTTAAGFYKVMTALGAKTVANHADFRLLSARAMRQLTAYPERNLFLRGMVPLLGYPSACVYYERKPRTAGESKYPLKRMLSFAWEGITSFTIKPLTLILSLGLMIMGCSLLALIYTLVSYCAGRVVPGWSSLMISVWFLGGVQLFCIGIVGQYLGKIYTEVKRRPRYTVEQFLEHTKDGGDGNDTPSAETRQ